MPGGCRSRETQKMNYLVSVVLLFCVACGSHTEDRAFESHVRHALIAWGQSQLGGAEIDPGAANDPPSGVPNNKVLYMRRDLVGKESMSDQTFQALKVTTTNSGMVYHGPELALCVGLVDVGWSVAYLKINANGSAVTDWSGAGKYAAALTDAVRDFRAELDGDVEFHIIAWQGTNEAKRETDGAARAWAAGYRLVHAAIEKATGQELRPIMPLEWPGTTGARWADAVNRQKEAVVAELGGRTISTDEILSRPGRVQSDGVHPTALGSNEVGEALSRSVVQQEKDPSK